MERCFWGYNQEWFEKVGVSCYCEDDDLLCNQISDENYNYLNGENTYDEAVMNYKFLLNGFECICEE